MTKPPDDFKLIEQFQAIGKPAYSDVTDRGECWLTYEEAKADGERILRSGNWLHFQITKWFALIPPELSDAAHS